jgi:hypothetical protein
MCVHVNLCAPRMHTHTCICTHMSAQSIFIQSKRSKYAHKYAHDTCTHTNTVCSLHLWVSLIKKWYHAQTYTPHRIRHMQTWKHISAYTVYIYLWIVSSWIFISEDRSFVLYVCTHSRLNAGSNANIWKKSWKKEQVFFIQGHRSIYTQIHALGDTRSCWLCSLTWPCSKLYMGIRTSVWIEKCDHIHAESITFVCSKAMFSHSGTSIHPVKRFSLFQRLAL